MLKTFALVVSVVGVVTSVAGCTFGQPTKADLANHFNSAMHREFPDVTYTTMKLNTQRGGNWVVISGTSGGVTVYAAINLDYINMNMDAAAMGNALAAAGADGIEANLRRSGIYQQFYIGPDTGNVYEETQGTPKDLEKVAAAVEVLQFNKFAQNLAANYGLSEERSFQVAKVSLQWNKLSKSRAMTDADVDSFSKDLIGMSLSDAQGAFETAQVGDTASYDALITQAAAFNGVSPEQMRKIVAQLSAQ